jgi:hypothetical protein
MTIHKHTRETIPSVDRSLGSTMHTAVIKMVVRERYGAIVSRGGNCCGPAMSGSRSGCGDLSLAVG